MLTHDFIRRPRIAPWQLIIHSNTRAVWRFALPPFLPGRHSRASGNPVKPSVPRFREGRARAAGHNRQGRRECRLPLLRILRPRHTCHPWQYCREQKSADTAKPRASADLAAGECRGFAAGVLLDYRVKPDNDGGVGTTVAWWR